MAAVEVDRESARFKAFVSSVSVLLRSDRDRDDYSVLEVEAHVNGGDTRFSKGEIDAMLELMDEDDKLLFVDGTVNKI